MNIRRYKQIGEIRSDTRSIPRFHKPKVEITPGTVMLLEYKDGTHDKVIVQPPPKDVSRCRLCAYGSGDRKCPVYKKYIGCECMFDPGYAVRADNVLEEI